MGYKYLGKTSEYIRSILPAEKETSLQAILQYADKNFVPVLLPETAALLKQLIKLKQPKNILEIGMAIGYSGSIMLSAYSGSHLYTIELSEKSIEVAKQFFATNKMTDRVTIYEGDASNIVPMLSGTYDFIFLDGPKAQYIEYLPFLVRALNNGGVLVCDNVLYNGMVSGENTNLNKQGGIVKKLDLFLHTLLNDKTLTSSILNVGDGLSVSIKEN